MPRPHGPVLSSGTLCTHPDTGPRAKAPGPGQPQLPVGAACSRAQPPCAPTGLGGSLQHWGYWGVTVAARLGHPLSSGESLRGPQRQWEGHSGHTRVVRGTPRGCWGGTPLGCQVVYLVLLGGTPRGCRGGNLGLLGGTLRLLGGHSRAAERVPVLSEG